MFRLFFITILTIQRLEGATASNDCGKNGENWMGLSGNQNLPNQPLKDIESACDCDDQCTSESDCEYWVYDESSNACWLKKNFDRVIDDSNCISGKKKGCEVKGENWMGSGEEQNLPNQPLKNIDSSHDCAEECSQESACEYWVYVETSSDCWLKRNFEGVVEDSNCISGWKKCCGVRGENWMGSGVGQNLPNQPLNDIASACECADKCNQESDCEYWVYVETSSDCWLKRDFEGVVEDSNCISGWKKYSGCGVNGENWMGSGAGQNLPNQPIKNVPDACECDQKCSHENSCEYWVHVEDSGDCWLKRNFENVVEDSNCISGLKKGCGVNGENWMGTGEGQNLPNQPLSNVGSACDCKEYCNVEEGCEYWVYDENTGACWLKKDFVKVVKDSNAISGWKKGCGINGENWMGFGEGQNLPDQPLQDVDSSCVCNEHCSTEDDCEYWVYVASSAGRPSECWLKRNFEEVVQDENCISGRKEEKTEETTGSWVLGDKGKTCQYTCALSGKTCNAAMQSTLFTNELLEEAMAEAGHECGSFHSPDSYAGTPLATGRSDDDCTPIKEGVTSSCTENRVARYQALCYCE